MTAYLETVREHRRWLHRHPETGFDLPKTHGYIREYLEGLGCFEIQVLARTGIKAVCRGGDKQAVAFRSDMDALSLTEQTGLPFASEHPGVMHGCGHDGHMAILLGFAQWIAEHRDSIERDITLLFQPAEESVGGAKPMIEEGALSNPDAAAVFGLHMFPDLPLGSVGFCAGPMMAQTCEFDVAVEGKSAHGALPHKGIDAVSAAAALVAGMQQIVSRRVDPYKPAVITIGRLTAGERRNIVAERALLEGTLRTFDEETYRSIRDHIDSLLLGVGQSYGVRTAFTEVVVYPAVVNPPGLTRPVAGMLGNRYREIEPLTIAEDFSYYQREAPGLFMMLGCGAGQDGEVHPLHSNRFDFNEAALSEGLDTYTTLLSHMDEILGNAKRG